MSRSVPSPMYMSVGYPHERPVIQKVALRAPELITSNTTAAAMRR
jgi:hypothetical protein